ncbi:hypothetical protein BBK82_41370 [Lentzea guizhouensis]|uniref:Peptidase inhibitor family I36 protein n=2 Tax=Lentzea guizhouensis TaxID=1586287 RepID=A0A1B2HUT8_9PSEU|nr:hypothetical protein BBK82_41370 [Lentzea guizhouensis]
MIFMKLAPVLFGRQAVIAAAAGALLLVAPLAVSADIGPEPAAPEPSRSAQARTAAPSTGPVAAGANCAIGNHCLFWGTVSSARKQYFDSVNHFNGDTFSGGAGAGYSVDNNSFAASNSSSSDRESHWYDGQFHTGAHFCVNPGATVNSLYNVGWHARISSLRLRPRTPERCLSN